ncbi:hypothetical protein [Bacillus sp. FJAT-42315]|nr:hypothetical protein [Bacillus sp. FJAT-42315]
MLKKQDQHNEKPKSNLTEEQQLINEFAKHGEGQPTPQPKDYEEIEY